MKFNLFKVFSLNGGRLNPIIKRVSEHRIDKLLNTSQITNKRYRYEQFAKYFDWGADWYGCFVNGELVALAVVKPDKFDSHYLAQIQSLVPGYGKVLLTWLIEHLYKLWFLADPKSEDTLKEYYRQFNLTEITSYSSIYNKNISLFFVLPASKLVLHAIKLYK